MICRQDYLFMPLKTTNDQDKNFEMAWTSGVTKGPATGNVTPLAWTEIFFQFEIGQDQ